MSAMRVTEIFAGVGFSEVLRPLGLHGPGLEMDPATCATRRAAEHWTVECDVTQHPVAPYAGTSGLIGGPPCPPFGKSGLKLGITDLPLVHEAIDDLARGRDTRAVHAAGCLDPRSILTAEPMRWLHALRPEWVILEQVPAVLPVWEHYGRILDGWGYSTTAGVLRAEHHGAGQARPRAIFLASRVRGVALPAPTHGGPGQPPIVAMADVIQWGYTQRPSPAVTGGGVYTGGAEPFGNGSRQAMRKVFSTDAWQDRAPLCAQCLVDTEKTAKVPAQSAEDEEQGQAQPCKHLRPTVAECAALQGFRPDLVFYGKSGQQYLQVGNAVPEALARAAVLAASGIGERGEALAA